MPNPKTRDTSVFRTSKVSQEEIWEIGRREVGEKRGKPIKGRADIKVSVISLKKLNVVPAEPPEKHANIKDWPDERSAQISIAIQLAAESQLHVK